MQVQSSLQPFGAARRGGAGRAVTVTAAKGSPLAPNPTAPVRARMRTKDDTILQKGDLVKLCSGGRDSYGDPVTRDPDAAVQALARGYASGLEDNDCGRSVYF